MAKASATYEAMFLFGANAATETDKAIATAKGIIDRHEGQILVIKKWDERKLSYEIKGNKRGTYVVAFFTAPGGAIAQIERDVNLSEEVLRVIVTRADHLNKDEMAAVEPQPIQPKEERPSWDRPWENASDRPPRRDDRSDRAPRRRDEEPAGAGKE
jgi:small subunit ribosomal protein S6